ncbi:MAG: TetR/AcrR family transcriptional regulator [Myxococcales bacterium]|nr:TetR/AcrR family transcriptional regulator [Myxococcales bacterium]
MSEKPMARRILEVTLELIDENHGLTGVDLRKISRALGCAHTNIYNYFDSYPDLLWHTLVEAVERLVNHTEMEMAKTRRKRDAFRVFIGSQIDFAQAHPGWYRFIWMEPLPGAPRENLVPKLAQPAADFARHLAAIAPAAVPATAIARAADIVHGYLHGVLSRLVAGRYIQGVGPELREKIIADAELVFQLLCAETTSSKKGTKRQ